MLLKEDLGKNKWPMTRVLKIEPDSSGVVRNVELRTVGSLYNQKLLRRPINKIMLLVEHDMVRLPTAKINKSQDDTTTCGKPYVEALTKKLLAKIKL